MDDTQAEALLLQVSAYLNQLAAPWLGAEDRLAEPQALLRESRIDPLSGRQVHCGRWPPDRAGRRGELSINEDGSFFAEFDLLLWRGEEFIEAVSAWGRSERMRGELRILRLPD